MQSSPNSSRCGKAPRMHYDRSCARTEWSGDARLCVYTSLAWHVDLFRISSDRVLRSSIRQLTSMALTNVAREEAELKIENVCMQAIGLEAQSYFSRQCLHSGMAFAFCALLTVGLLFFSFGVSFWELWGLILGAKVVHFGSLGGPWHLEKINPEQKFKKGGFVSRGLAPFGDHFGSIFR